MNQTSINPGLSPSQVNSPYCNDELPVSAVTFRLALRCKSWHF